MYCSKLDISYSDGTTQSCEIYYLDVNEFNCQLPKFLSLIHMYSKTIDVVKITCSKVSEK